MTDKEYVRAEVERFFRRDPIVSIAREMVQPYEPPKPEESASECAGFFRRFARFLLSRRAA